MFLAGLPPSLLHTPSLAPSYLWNRDEIKCREKWMNVLDPQLNTKPFTPEEDLILLRETASLPPMTDAQPTQSNLESDGIYRLAHSLAPFSYSSPLCSTGANWAAIASKLPGRTDNHVWRRWKELNGDPPPPPSSSTR
jgi:hypothetical protein